MRSLTTYANDLSGFTRPTVLVSVRRLFLKKAKQLTQWVNCPIMQRASLLADGEICCRPDRAATFSTEPADSAPWPRGLYY